MNESAFLKQARGMAMLSALSNFPGERLPAQHIRHWLMFIALVVALIGYATVCGAVSVCILGSIPLAGTWRFRLDPDGVGVTKQWFKDTLDESVTLPGTTDTNKKGIFKDEKALDRLSRVWYWKGPAWYQRDVVIPESWRGKRITLLLERTKNVRVWVDDQDCGADDTLSAFQIFDLTRALKPGRR